MSKTLSPAFFSAINKIDVEILDGSYVRGDSKWKKKGVNSPFSRLYFFESGSARLFTDKQNITMEPNNVYLVPNAPYNILSEDAGAGRLIGLSWMRMLAYKNLTMDNVVDNADDFYEDFYHSNLSDTEIKKLLNFN